MKYGPSFEDVCSRREEAASRLDRIEHRTERLEELRASIAALRKQMDAAGQALTRARQDSAPRLAASIVRHSRELGFRQAVFEVSLSPSGTGLTGNGNGGIPVWPQSRRTLQASPSDCLQRGTGAHHAGD